MSKRFVKPAAWTFAAYIAGLAANLIVSVIVARVLGRSGAGIIVLALVVPNVLAVLANLGLPRALAQMLRTGELPARRAVTLAAIATFVTATLVAAAYLLAWPLIAQLLNAGPQLDQLAPLAAGILVLEAVLQLLMGACQGFESFGRRSAILLAFRWLYVAFTVLGLLLVGPQIGINPSPAVVLASSLAAYLAAAMLGLLLVRRLIIHSEATDFAAGMPADAAGQPARGTAAASSSAMLRRMLGFGWRTHITAALMLLVLRADVVLLGWLLADEEPVGLYSRAVQVAEVVLYLMLAMEAVIYVRVGALGKKAGPRAAADMCRIGLSVALLLVAAFMLASHWLIVVPFGDEFQSSVVPLRILLPGVMAVGLAHMIMAIFQAAERPWPAALLTAGGLALITALDLLLIPPLGIVGAAWASLAAYVAMAFAAVFWFSRWQKLSPLRLLLVRPGDFKALGELLPHRQRADDVPEAEGELPPAEG